jgi:hypothetical protein
MRGISLFAACCLLAGSQQAPGRDAAAPAGTAVLSGTIVTDDRDARPVRRAQVQLRSADSFLGLEVITDDTGSFTFAGLRAGRYQLSASKPGMVPSRWVRGGREGRARPSRSPTASGLLV